MTVTLVSLFYFFSFPWENVYDYWKFCHLFFFVLTLHLSFTFSCIYYFLVFFCWLYCYLPLLCTALSVFFFWFTEFLRLDFLLVLHMCICSKVGWRLSGCKFGQIWSILQFMPWNQNKHSKLLKTIRTMTWWLVVR